MTIREALNSAKTDDARRLLAFVLERPSSFLVAHEDDELAEPAAERFHALLQRRLAGEPLAYVLGSAGFFHREFLVDSSVLIPRPETEHLVETAIAHIRSLDNPRVLDVGTGSGAIACTIAAEVPRVRVDAVEISSDAIEVAKANRERLQLGDRVTLYLGDLLEPVADERYDAIVANLPYVPVGEGDADLRFEPAIALYAGVDGLDAYRRFFASVPPLVRPGGLVLAEGAPPIAAGLRALAEAAFPHARVTLVRDYGNRDRFVKVETPG